MPELLSHSVLTLDFFLYHQYRHYCSSRVKISPTTVAVMMLLLAVSLVEDSQSNLAANVAGVGVGVVVSTSVVPCISLTQTNLLFS